MLVGEHQLDAQPRVLRQGLRHHRQHKAPAEAHPAADAHQALQRTPTLADLLGQRQRLQRHARMGHHLLTFRGQGQLPGGAVEQAHAERAFQLRHPLAHGRGCQVQLARGFREAAGLGGLHRGQEAGPTFKQRVHGGRPIRYLGL